MDELICCFSGHRRISGRHSLFLVSSLKKVIKNKYKQGYRIFRAGGALGFDTVAALSVLELRRELPDIKLHLVLPCKNQTAKWNGYEERIYYSILDQADSVVYAEELYTAGCMHKRNRMLVDGAQCCIAYYDVRKSEKSGTEYTCNYALSRNVEVINLW